MRQAFACFFLCLVCAPMSRSQVAGTSSSETSFCAEAPPEFLRWAARNMISLKTTEAGNGFSDLQSLKGVIGDARVVGIGEAARRVHEFYQIRHRLLEFVVEELNFTAFAMETGFAEATNLNDFVLGRIDEPKSWRQWFTFGYGDEAELQELVRWMRRYNDDPKHSRKIHFYGIDVMVPYSSPLTALQGAFAYLEKVDPDFISSTTRKDLLASVEKFLGSGDSRKNMEVSLRKYLALPVQDRNAYTVGIADLIARFEAKRAEYVGRSSDETYQWAYHTAIAARQLDTTYRAAAASLKPGQQPDVPTAIWATRDAAMMENLLWALTQEGSEGRILVWAHNAHVSKGTVPSDRSDVVGLWEKGPRLGMLLDLTLGKKYVAIGTSFNEGRSGWQQPRRPAECGTLDRELARSNSQMFFLDFVGVNSDTTAYNWLNEVRIMRADNASADYRVTPLQAWDGVLFIRDISPVRIAAGPQ